MNTLTAATAPGTRLYSLDAIRGFAVFAMVVAHTAPYIRPAPQPLHSIQILLNDVAAPLFALTIGATIALTGPHRTSEPAPWRRYRTQTLVKAALLIGLGLLLSMRYSGVHIVLAYLGVAMILALPLVRLSSRALLAWSVPLLLVVPGAVTLLRGSADVTAKLVDPEARYTVVWDWLLLGTAYQALNLLPLVLIGVLLGRHVLQHRRYALWLLITAALCFVPFKLWKMMDLPGADIRGGYVEALGEAPLAVGAFCFFAWITTAGGTATRKRLERLLMPITVQGRMALSIYVLHIVVLMGVTTARAEAAPSMQRWFGPPEGWLIQLGLVVICWAFAAVWWRWLGAGPVERLMGVASGRHRPSYLAHR